MKRITSFVMVLAMVAFVGCGQDTYDAPVDSPEASAGGESSGGAAAATTTTGELPAFSVTASEYPSWSTFMVAAKAGLINPDQGGEPGPLELKYGVDVILQVKDYDPCLTMFANGACDATCMTNMDSLNPALGRASTAICPTSQSLGADKVIAVGFKTVQDLKGQKVYGLAKSVSEYLFVRGLEKQGENPLDYEFANLDPGAAATALQTGSNDVKAIDVWNPFALQTLRTTKDSTTIFDSSIIPGEIVDMIVIGNDSLAKPGGPEFAACLCDIFYQVSNKLSSTDSAVADATLTALGEDFSNLPLDDMRIVIKETQFYATPQDGITLFTSDQFKETMKIVVSTCQNIGVLEDKVPTIGYGDSSAQLNFDPQYMEKVAGN